jgi:hypothetical protein
MLLHYGWLAGLTPARRPGIWGVSPALLSLGHGLSTEVFLTCYFSARSPERPLADLGPVLGPFCFGACRLSVWGPKFSATCAQPRGSPVVFPGAAGFLKALCIPDSA